MKNRSSGPKLILLLVSTIPFLVGSFLNYAATVVRPEETPPFKIFAIGSILVWILIAYIMRPKLQSMEELMIWQNAVPFIDLVLLCLQELILRSYFPGILGAWTQFYYLPILVFGYDLTTWTHRMFTAYIASFLLLALAAYLGGKAREGRK